MANKLIKNQGGNLHEIVQNICCSPTGCGGWGCCVVTQRVALGYICSSLSGSCMYTHVMQKARKAKTNIARGNTLGIMDNAMFMDGTHHATAAQRAATYIAWGNTLGTMDNAMFMDGTHHATAAQRAATHIARGNTLGTMSNAMFGEGTHRATAACRAATHIAKGNALGTMDNIH